MEAARQMLAVLAVFGLLAALVWRLRSRGIAGFGPLRTRVKTGLLEPVQRVQLTPTHSLHLVRFGDRALLLSVSPAGSTLIDASQWAAVAAGIASRDSGTVFNEGSR